MRKASASLRVAVVADNKFERGLAVELLRTFRITDISQFDDPDFVLHLRPRPDVAIWIWASRDYELLRKLTWLCRSVRFIIVDGTPSPEMVALSLQAGATSVLSRPYSIRDLLLHIDRAAIPPAADQETIAI